MIQRRNGTINHNRQGKDLLNSPFKIDQHTFWDIIGYIRRYLEKINYYNVDNQVEGNWKSLVEGDPIVYMVMIINYPTEKIEKLIASYEHGAMVDKNIDNEIKVLTDWYDRIDHWHYQLLYFGEKRLSYKIKNIVVDVLLPEKNKLISYQQSQIPQAGDTDTKSFSVSSPSIPDPNAEVYPKKILNTFHRIIVHIKEFVKEYLQQNIYDNNQHRPNNAMYLAFALLFKSVQKQLNGFSKKHLDFYYKDILQQQLGKGRPTRAIVNFELLPTIANTLLPKGTMLSAGKLFGGKTDVLFEMGKPLVAYNITLMQMQTLLLKTSRVINIGTDRPLISYAAKNVMMKNGKLVGTKEDWFAFGANKKSVQNTGIPENQLADLGFIIGSPVLFLSEGKRTIEICINLEETTAKGILWTLLNEIKENRKLSLDTVFHGVFAQAFKISFSTANGWTDFDDYTVNFNEGSNTFSINLLLENGDPKLEKSTKTPEVLKWPSIKIVLNEYAPVFAYSFLKGVTVDTVQINVAVEGVKEVALYNNIGKMPLGKPFDLFGPMPNVGGYLIIGKNELFQKTLDTLNILLDWENIPNDYGGLNTYYSGYSDNLGNESFKVSFNALSGGYWLPTTTLPALTFDLFQAQPCVTPEGYESEKLKQTTEIEVADLETIVVNQMADPVVPLLYTVNSQSGFVKLTLTAPQEGFGAKAYEEEYLKIATYNARAIVKNRPQRPFPNRPFIPKVKGVSLNYKASDTLFFKPNPSSATNVEHNVGEFIHVTPFGPETIIDGNKGILKHTLLPDFEAEGYLFLGFSGVKDRTMVSLYFHFLHSSTAVDLSTDGLIWEYYRLNEWVGLEDSDIILDGTNGFTKSGIVEMIFPKTSTGNEEETLTPTTFWVRIATKSNSIHYPKIKGIYLNAAEVVCVDRNSTIVGKEIPASSIAKLVGKFPDIKDVNQAAASFGGFPVEAPNQFYTRVSERLRHKSRALTIWDYERLVLENFEEVLVAKCTNFDESFHPTPGLVKVVVLSTKWTNDERNYFDGETLIAIKNVLQKLASPFANIKVMNPKVEYLLVNCVVKFKAEDNGGYYINKLNDDISHFLSPIANIDNGNGGIGGNVVPTMLVSYIEKLPYIAMVGALTIEHIVRKGIDDYSLGVFTGGQEITTTTPEAILSPVEKHQIIITGNEGGTQNILDVGIGTMEIGLDFILGVPKPQTPEDATIPTEKVKSTDQDLADNALLVFKTKSNKA